MEIILRDQAGSAVSHLIAASDVELVEFPEVERDVVIFGFSLDGIEYATAEPVMVRAGQFPRLNIWR